MKSYSKTIYFSLACLFALCLFVQVFLAGLALFDNGDWSSHTTFIHYFEFTPIVMLLFAALGRIGWRMILLTAGLYLLIIFQYMSVNMDAKFIAALHPVSAMLMLWGTVTVIRRSNPWSKSSTQGND